MNFINMLLAASGTIMGSNKDKISTHTHNSLSEYWQGDLSNVNDNNEWYNSWYTQILHEYWWDVK
jgi:hypothetical protein